MDLFANPYEANYSYKKAEYDQLTVRNYVDLFTSGQRVAFIGKKRWARLKKAQNRMAFSRAGFGACHKCKVVFCCPATGKTLHEFEHVKSLREVFKKSENSNRKLLKNLAEFFDDYANIDLAKDGVLTILPFDCEKSCYIEQPKVEIQELFGEEFKQNEDSEITSKTDSLSEDRKYFKDRILAIEQRANEIYDIRIKGKYLDLDDENKLEAFKSDLKHQKNRVLWLFREAKVGCETQQDLQKELDEVKLKLHKYVLPEDLEKKLQKLRRQLEDYVELYAKALPYLLDS